MVNRTRGQDAIDNLRLGLRLGERPRLMVTTTPRAGLLIRALLALDGLVVTRGTTSDNAANLPANYLSAMIEQFGGSRWGRQEIGGELIEDAPGALWTRATIEGARIRPEVAAALLARVVVGVDPPASSGGDACGIVVAGMLGLSDDLRGEAPRLAVMEDASVERASPERWARAVAGAARRWRADAIVAEANMGGEMVRRVIEAEDASLPVTLVHASRGKAVRAEPVAHAYARGRVAHAGVFPALEDQLCGLVAGGAYAGPGRSPDRADAAIWALQNLMAAMARDGPTIRRL